MTHAAASSSGSAAAAADPEQPAAKMRKLENRLRAAEDQLKAARRRLENSAGAKGAGKRHGGKNRGSNGPEALRGKFTRLANGDPICFDFHLGGCSVAKVGQRCPRGWHLCPEPVNGAACGGAHTLQQHA